MSAVATAVLSPDAATAIPKWLKNCSGKPARVASACAFYFGASPATAATVTSIIPGTAPAAAAAAAVGGGTATYRRRDIADTDTCDGTVEEGVYVSQKADKSVHEHAHAHAHGNAHARRGWLHRRGAARLGWHSARLGTSTLIASDGFLGEVGVIMY